MTLRQFARLENGPETRLQSFSIAYQPSLLPRMSAWGALILLVIECFAPEGEGQLCVSHQAAFLL
jgi:hypothetical protein